MSYVAKTDWKGNDPVTEGDLNRWEVGIEEAHEDASVTKKGRVQLSNETDSTSETLAATPKSVKDAKDALSTQIGNLSGLNTTAKSNLVAAVNELFTFANDGKTKWSNVVGSPLASSDTFTQMQTKTQTVKNTLATNLTAKGQSSLGTETLTALVNKVANVETGKKLPSINPTGLSFGNTTSAVDFFNDGTDTYSYFSSPSSAYILEQKINADGTVLLSRNIDTFGNGTSFVRRCGNNLIYKTLGANLKITDLNGTVLYSGSSFSSLLSAYFEPSTGLIILLGNGFGSVMNTSFTQLSTNTTNTTSQYNTSAALLRMNRGFYVFSCTGSASTHYVTSLRAPSAGTYQWRNDVVNTGIDSSSELIRRLMTLYGGSPII